MSVTSTVSHFQTKLYCFLQVQFLWPAFDSWSLHFKQDMGNQCPVLQTACSCSHWQECIHCPPKVLNGKANLFGFAVRQRIWGLRSKDGNETAQNFSFYLILYIKTEKTALSVSDHPYFRWEKVLEQIIKIKLKEGCTIW